jgi:DNA anti-recombination protein RmuC
VSARDLSAAEIDIALTCFAIEGGREKPTKKLLRAAKISVSMQTLRNWAYNVHKERYWTIKVEAEKLVGTQMADTYQRLAETSAELSEEVLARLTGKLARHDREIVETEERLEDCEDELKEVRTAIDAAQIRLADSLEIPNVDALLEEVLGERPEEADSELVAELTQLYRRREGLVNESRVLWERRDRLEVGFQDLTKILHESGVMGGIATEKLQLLTGGATERVEHSFPELQRALEAKGVRLGVGQGAPRALPAPVPIDSVPTDG